MSAPHIILDYLPCFCRKLSELVEISRSYDKNNFACFLDTVYTLYYSINRHHSGTKSALMRGG